MCLWCFRVLMVKNTPLNAGGIRVLGLIRGLERSSEGRHNSPFQYSCLDNPMDRGGWRATVHGVTKSQTQLKCTFSMHVWCFKDHVRKWGQNRKQKRERLFLGIYLDRIEISDICSLFLVLVPRMRREVRSLFYDILHSAYFFLHLIEQLSQRVASPCYVEREPKLPI